MKTRILWSLLGIALMLALVASPAWGQRKGLAVQEREPPVRQERRIALVIGNSRYATAGLRNPVRDARAMARTLRSVGFEVEVLEDAGQADMKRAVDDFGDRLQSSGGVGLFYYSGHGVQVNGQNHMIPVDARIRSERDVEYLAVNVGRVLGRMEGAKNRMNIVILDACRDNPFSRSFRSARRGLATLDAASGTFIAYATSPGNVADDGDGEFGLYTGKLVRHMTTPGLKLEDVFKRVRSDVERDSDGGQVPWESSSLKGDFYFVAGLPIPPPVVSTPIAASPSMSGGLVASGVVLNLLGVVELLRAKDLHDQAGEANQSDPDEADRLLGERDTALVVGLISGLAGIFAIANAVPDDPTPASAGTRFQWDVLPTATAFGNRLQSGIRLYVRW